MNNVNVRYVCYPYLYNNVIKSVVVRTTLKQRFRLFFHNQVSINLFIDIPRDNKGNPTNEMIKGGCFLEGKING